MLLFLASLFTAQAGQNINFPELLSQVDKAIFGSEQLMIISAIPEDEELSAKQVAKLIDELAFSKDKLKALRELTSHISDPHNAYLILDSFDFATDKKEAQRIIEKLHTENKEDTYAITLAELENRRVYLEEKERELIQREQELDDRERRLIRWKERLQERKNRLLQREQLVAQREQALEDREISRRSRSTHDDDYEGYYGRQRRY